VNREGNFDTLKAFILKKMKDGGPKTKKMMDLEVILINKSTESVYITGNCIS
jgi:hypothetical protein